ncbi:MAG: hypothetical protein ABR955_04135 [Verrucomicrobiota bacterium]
MNHEDFICELKDMVCRSDWHKRYYTKRARKFNSRNYWLKGALGVVSAIGALNRFGLCSNVVITEFITT